MVLTKPNEPLERRIDLFRSLFSKIADVPGDIVECGVLRGTSLSILARLAQEEGQARMVWGFDAWEQVGSTPEDEGMSVNWYPKKDKLIYEKVAKQGVFPPEEWVTLVKGRVEETLPGWKELKTPIAFLHIDVGLYSGYKACLENLWQWLSPGGVIVMDEYHRPGTRKAVQDFMSARGDWRLQEGHKWWIQKLSN